MVTELDTLVEPLKRAVAVPGTFDDIFPVTSDQDLTDTLLTASAEAQLHGFFAGYSATDDALVDPDLPRAGGALVVIYAATRTVASHLLPCPDRSPQRRGG